MAVVVNFEDGATLNLHIGHLHVWSYHAARK
jgi:hypothetical protein